MVHRSIERTFPIQWRANSSARMLKTIGISKFFGHAPASCVAPVADHRQCNIELARRASNPDLKFSIGSRYSADDALRGPVQLIAVEEAKAQAVVYRGMIRSSKVFGSASPRLFGTCRYGFRICDCVDYSPRPQIELRLQRQWEASDGCHLKNCKLCTVMTVESLECQSCTVVIAASPTGRASIYSTPPHIVMF
jgi:hypothetical protein